VRLMLYLSERLSLALRTEESIRHRNQLCVGEIRSRTCKVAPPPAGQYISSRRGNTRAHSSPRYDDPSVLSRK